MALLELNGKFELMYPFGVIKVNVSQIGSFIVAFFLINLRMLIKNVGTLGRST